MVAFISYVLLGLQALGFFRAPEFKDTIRTIRFGTNHTADLPVAVIEGLLTAVPLDRPLSSDSLNAVRASFENITLATGTNISDEVIEELQGRHGRKLWGPGFVDVTGYDDEMRSLEVITPHYPTPNPAKHPELKAMFAVVNASEIKEYVTHLSTAYATRHYLSRDAQAPASWIRSKFVESLGQEQVKLVENKFQQPNVIARIEAKSGRADAPVVILGAHLDSISQTPSKKAPGADDDASGVAVILVVMRILQQTNYQSDYAIEAHAYGGEEGGLLGSKVVAQQYKSAKKKIRGMLHLEMIGYQPSTATNKGKSSTITVLFDPVPAMGKYMSEIVNAYTPSAELRNVSCGYGCSDHNSFFEAGYPVVCIAAYGPHDKNLNPNYHTTTDTVDKLNFEKTTDFVKVALGFVVEATGS